MRIGILTVLNHVRYPVSLAAFYGEINFRFFCRAHGAYLLRTNYVEGDQSDLWKWYIQLTQAEAAFRTAIDC